jgi:ribosomal protein S18 acetylase RimI-like enzyme
MSLPPGCEITFSDVNDDEDWRYVRKQLQTFNHAALPEFFDPDQKLAQINYYLRDEQGAILGGVLCEVVWKTLLVNFLWVDAEQRGRGMGRHLLNLAEAAGREKGCAFAMLTTFDFQARGFYEKQGYVVVGKMENFPPGHTYYSLRKDF